MNKKLILSIGTLGAVVAPVAAVVACGDKDTTPSFTLKEDGSNFGEFIKFMGDHTTGVRENQKYTEEIKVIIGDKTFVISNDMTQEQQKAFQNAIEGIQEKAKAFAISEANKKIAEVFAKAIEEANPSEGFDFSKGAYMPGGDAGATPIRYTERQSFGGISKPADIHPVLTLSQGDQGIIATYTDAFLQKNSDETKRQVVFNNQHEFDANFGHKGDETKTTPKIGSEWLTFWNFVDVSEVKTLVDGFFNSLQH